MVVHAWYMLTDIQKGEVYCFSSPGIEPGCIEEMRDMFFAPGSCAEPEKSPRNKMMDWFGGE